MRYDRQIAMPEIGEEGQQKIVSARVLIVGVGGLGSPVALYLAAAGVGTIGLIDDDCVSETNLQRQILYDETQIGQRKVLCAKQRLASLNSNITIQTHDDFLTKENAEQIIKQYDIVVDACDNFATRFLISDTCKSLRKPMIYGSIGSLEGQVAVFSHQTAVSYRTLFPDEKQLSKTTKNASPVIGVTPAVVGSIQANEVLKLICAYGESLTDKLLTIDLRDYSVFIMNL